MLNKFSDFLLLESVINKDVKTLTEVIYNEFHSKEKEFEEKGILILENFLENNVKELIFFNDKIIFQDSDYPNSGFKCDKVKNKIIFSLTLVIECQKNYTEFSLKESITHELTHMLEYYHSKNEERQSNLKRVEYDDWEKYKKLREHQSKFKNFKEYIDKITYLFYETLGFEMRSRAAQTYQYLKSLNTYNVDILTNELKNSMEWKKMNSIIKINPYKFLETIKKICPYNNQEIFEDFMSNVLKEEFTENNFIKYINRIKTSCYKQKKKLGKLIGEVAKEKILNGKELIEEYHNYYIDYSEYIRKTLEDL